MKNKKYYAVRIGRVSGVYESWIECEEQVKGYPRAEFKAFNSKEDAITFIEGVSKYYAVRQGRRPGVYRSWEECEKQVKGYSGAAYQAFDSEEDAYSFL